MGRIYLAGPRSLSYLVNDVRIHINKSVIDRRLRPRCCHMGSYFKRPKSSPVRPLACDWFYWVHSLQPSPRLRVQCASAWRRRLATLAYEQINVTRKTGSIKHITTPPEDNRATAIASRHKKFGEIRTCSSEDMIADRQTKTERHTYRQTDRHAHHDTPLPCRGRVKYKVCKGDNGVILYRIYASRFRAILWGKTLINVC